MFLRSFGLMLPLALGGLWFGGALGGGFARDVDRTPAQVMAALADLDIREQPGSPGTDSSASGGVRPVFRTERAPDSISFVVMSRDKVAMRMIAHLQPLDDGRRTRVTASVERGDAPDELVSPAFRSNGITLGLFQAALQQELDELTIVRRSREECRELEQRLLLENAGTIGGEERSLQQGARTVLAVHRAAAQLRQAGCPLDGGGAFEPVSNRMGAGGGGGQSGVSFEPGRPMVDPGRSAR